MRHLKDETKPEGFHTEFKLNVKFIFFIGTFVAIVTIVIIKYFI
ncbi:MAG TPA: hypothetical protein VNZ49_09495 [Bacteroidia bacterium]|jgi:hypothetical protein|nr:hypothetical protein [Bacteroidia bacterium]